MSAGSLRERLAEALYVFDRRRPLSTRPWVEVPNLVRDEYRAHADGVLAEVRAWLGSKEARDVVAAEIACGVDYPGGTAYDALEALAALIDQTKDEEATA